MIGIIDSGFGGLSIYQHIQALLPQHSTIYLGDHAYVPYSAKTKRVIQTRIRKIITFLLSQQVSLIVIACNTATVAGIDMYRKWFPTVPIVGVVPVIKTAVAITKTKNILVLSTPFTASSDYQKKLITQFAGNCTVYNVGCPNLVSYVESGNIYRLVVTKELRAILMSYMKNNIDVIALGCTHYPFLRDQIRAIVGESVHIFDSGGAVARQVVRIVEHNHMKPEKSPHHEFYSTRQWTEASDIASRLIEKQIVIRYASI